MKKELFFKAIAICFIFFAASCSKDEDPELTATVSFSTLVNDVDGDVIGNGGNATQSYTWNNSMTTANYDMDITSVSGGSFTLTITDADGKPVASQTLISGQGDDTAGGVSQPGVAGDWTVTVTLVNFNGDGSFSVSRGN